MTLSCRLRRCTTVTEEAVYEVAEKGVRLRIASSARCRYSTTSRSSTCVKSAKKFPTASNGFQWGSAMVLNADTDNNGTIDDAAANTKLRSVITSMRKADALLRRTRPCDNRL